MDGGPTYTWDAENRLSCVQSGDPNSPADGDTKVEFVYDYLGRRVEKQMSEHNGTSWSVSDRRRFVWSDWLLVLELEGGTGVPPVNTVLRKYTWGLDLGGTGVSPVIDSAGGIGGLLAAYDADSSKDYLYFHDANGNVGQLIDRSDGTIAAKYEYDAYGNNLLDPNDPNESGPYADDNPFRFSTKYWDDETALGYWGYRYYTPRLGRWIRRDPLDEQASISLYGYTLNTPTTTCDFLGLQTSQPTSERCCYCGPDITQAIIDHLNAFVARRRGNLSPWPPTGARRLAPIARRNAARFWDAVTNSTGACGAGDCAGTATICNLCISGYHIDHILIMAYISENYGEWLARKAGERNDPGNDPAAVADRTFNELALCFARAMRPSHDKTRFTGDPTIPYITERVSADLLTESELCNCVENFTDEDKARIARKEGKGTGAADWEDCNPCDEAIAPPAGLELPPLDPY